MIASLIEYSSDSILFDLKAYQSIFFEIFKLNKGLFIIMLSFALVKFFEFSRIKTYANKITAHRNFIWIHGCFKSIS